MCLEVCLLNIFRVYKDLTEQNYAAFREMCSTKNEGMYLKLLPQLTEEFRTVSEGVMACEKRVLSQGQHDLAKTIRLIQDQERTKLQATISLQALQKAQAFETLPWQTGDEAAWSEPAVSRSSGDFFEVGHAEKVDLGLRGDFDCAVVHNSSKHRTRSRLCRRTWAWQA